jgi:hypothetical protein
VKAAVNNTFPIKVENFEINEQLKASQERQRTMESVMSYCLIYLLHCLNPSASCRTTALLYPCLGLDGDAVRIERLHRESPSE